MNRLREIKKNKQMRRYIIDEIDTHDLSDTDIVHSCLFFSVLQTDMTRDRYGHVAMWLEHESSDNESCV